MPEQISPPGPPIGWPPVDIGAEVPGGCRSCGNLATCTCSLEKKHKPGCRFLRAATLSMELACEHNLQACPICDPCDCGAGQTTGVL